jgi:hypothetical protein
VLHVGGLEVVQGVAAEHHAVARPTAVVGGEPAEVAEVVGALELDEAVVVRGHDPHRTTSGAQVPPYAAIVADDSDEPLDPPAPPSPWSALKSWRSVFDAAHSSDPRQRRAGRAVIALWLSPVVLALMLLGLGLLFR